MNTYILVQTTDWEELHSVFKESVGETCGADYSPEQLAAWITRADGVRWQELLNSNLIFLKAVCRECGEVVGFTSIRPDGYLHSMFVRPKFQRKGVATLLLQGAEELLCRSRVGTVTTEASLTARPFFEAQGFRVQRRQTVSVNGVEMDNFVMGKPLVTCPEAAEYDEMLEVWERAVRSTHHFLPEERIAYYRPLVREIYFPAVELYVTRDKTGKITALMGLSEDKIEMLFVDASVQGRGYGSVLLDYAVRYKKIQKVDVNEQNEVACRFYFRKGFRTVLRDELDGAGLPFPILHLEKQQTPFLTTARLYLRPFREEDAEAFYACCRNPNLGNRAGWKPHTSLEESVKILKSCFMSQDGVWAITNKVDGRLLGSIGLVSDTSRKNPAVQMLGYWLAEECWGKGYMTEAGEAVLDYAFRKQGLRMVTANCYPENEASMRVLIRLGFRKEGVLHGAELSEEGDMLDHICFYRLQ